VIAVDVLDEVKTIRFEKQHDFCLKIGVVASIFYSFLDNSTAVTVLRELENVFFDDSEQSFLMLLVSLLENLLKDVVAEFIFSELYAFFYQSLEDCVLRVRFSALNNGLNCSGTILIPRPDSRLLNVVHDFFLRSQVVVVERSWHMDRTVAMILLLRLQTESNPNLSVYFLYPAAGVCIFSSLFLLKVLTKPYLSSSGSLCVISSKKSS
jgi:hypothetical protein